MFNGLRVEQPRIIPPRIIEIAVTKPDIQAQLAELIAENARLKAAAQPKPKAAPPISFKVSEKGAVSVYGLQRFPVTLYKEQWQRLLADADKLAQFIADNSDKLTTK